MRVVRRPRRRRRRRRRRGGRARRRRQQQQRAALGAQRLDGAHRQLEKEVRRAVPRRAAPRRAAPALLTVSRSRRMAQ